MANIVAASDVMAGSGLYLDKAAKAELHQEQRPFYITHAVGEQDGQFGPQTIFTIREKDKDEAKLAFGASPARKELAEKISVAIANGANAVGPFYLGRWENGTRSGWTLTPEPTKPLTIPEVNEAPAVVSPPPSVQNGKAAHADDDLPF